MVINATVPPARITLPAYNPRERDAQIRQLRTLIDPILQRAEPLLVLGDFNVTQQEVAYHELTAGLQDTHLQVGRGFGNSWRPPFLIHLPLPLLRIDYLLSSPVVQPRSIETDCTLYRSDHCIVRGRFELEAR
jgi:endonuclease/exonuclease/phosphatase family metal-dependent hydrolase